MPQVAAAIDIAYHAALDVGVGGCHEVIIRIGIVHKPIFVHHRAALAAGIDVPIYIAAQ